MTETPISTANECDKPKPVLTKADFVRRYQRGEFGNAAPTWERFGDFMASDYRGLVHYRNRNIGGPTWYDIPYKRRVLTWNTVTQVVDPRDLYISAMAPTEKTVFQGEVQRGVWGLDLTYSLLPLTMRAALATNTLIARGLRAKALLEYFLCPNSTEWLWQLLDNYPGHVVEFSTYSVEWGTIPGYNTVFWEVRKY